MTRFLLITAVITTFSSISQAGRVLKIKGKKVYIQFENGERGTFGEDDLFFLVSPKGKKHAIVHLKKVKGLKAIAKIVKGRAKANYSTLFKSIGPKTRAKKAAMTEEDPLEFSTTTPVITERAYMGLLVGFGQLTQDVNQGGGNVSNQEGNSIQVKLLYDYPFMESLVLRTMFGVEMFSTEGQGFPQGSSTLTNLSSDVTYGTLDILFKWNLYHFKSSPMYLQGGMSIFQPFSKSSTVIREDSLDTQVIGQVGLGVDIHLGSMKIPLIVNYSVFPSGETVDTQLISFQTGLLW